MKKTSTLKKYLIILDLHISKKMYNFKQHSLKILPPNFTKIAYWECQDADGLNCNEILRIVDPESAMVFNVKLKKIATAARTAKKISFRHYNNKTESKSIALERTKNNKTII